MIRPATVYDLTRVQELSRTVAVNGMFYAHFTPPLLVLELEGVVQGYCHALLGQPYAVITELVVAPEVHGKGYGAQLLDGMELVLRVAGCKAWVGFMAQDHAVLDGLRRRAVDTGAGVGFFKYLDNDKVLALTGQG